MLDNQDKEYIRNEINREIRESEKRMITYFDNELMPKFNALFDLIKTTQQEAPTAPENITERVEALETVVKYHSNEIHKLKKAQ